jgi:teichuronic acid exporter
MQDRTDIRAKVNRGIAWIGTASTAVAVLDIVAWVLILKFWISPTELGIAQLAIAIFPVLDLATDAGITAAVIQRDDHTEERISTIFYLNALLSVVVAAIVALGLGPLLSWVYAQPVLVGLLAAYAAKLLWQNVYLIPSALMHRELRFRELSIVRMFANMAEFGGKVGFAAAGFGVWCFVLGPLCRVFVTGVGVQICNPWRPRLVFRLRSALDWFLFGIKASGHKIVFHLYTNVDYFVVGYLFGVTANGFYATATKMVLEPARWMSEVVTAIAFPAFARLKLLRDRLVDQLVTFTRLNLVIMLGFGGLILIAADDLLGFIDPEWAQAAPAARILVVVVVLRAQGLVLPPLLDGIGRPGLSLLYQLVAAVVVPAMFVLCAVVLGNPFVPLFAPRETGLLDLGYLSVAVGWAAGYPIAFGVLAYIVIRLLEIEAVDFLRRIWRIAAWAALATAVGLAVAAAVGDQTAGVRVLAAALAYFTVFLFFLARMEGMTPRKIAQSMREEAPPAEPFGSRLHR